MSSATPVPAAASASPSPAPANLAPPAQASSQTDPRVKGAAAAALAAAAFDRKEAAAATQTFFEDRGLRVGIVPSTQANGYFTLGFDWHTEMQKGLPVTVKVSEPVSSSITVLKLPVIPQNKSSNVVYQNVVHQRDREDISNPFLVSSYVSDRGNFFETEAVPNEAIEPGFDQIDVEVTGIISTVYGDGSYGVMIKGPDGACSMQCWVPSTDDSNICTTLCSAKKFVIHGYRKTEFIVQPILSKTTFHTKKSLNKGQCLVKKEIQLSRGRAYRFKISLDIAKAEAGATQVKTIADK